MIEISVFINNFADTIYVDTKEPEQPFLICSISDFILVRKDLFTNKSTDSAKGPRILHYSYHEWVVFLYFYQLIT